MKSIDKEQFEKGIRFSHLNYLYRSDELHEFNTSLELFISIAFLISGDNNVKLYDKTLKDTLDIEFTEWRDAFLSKKYEKISCNQMIISLCSMFENYICDILRVLYMRAPKALLAKDKKARDEQSISFENLLNHNSLESLFYKTIEERIHKYIYDPIKKTVNKIKIFYPDFVIDEKKLNEISDVFQIRNVLVHNRGIVNEDFMKRIFNKEKYKLGQTISISFDSVKSLFIVFDGTVEEIEVFLLRKCEGADFI